MGNLKNNAKKLDSKIEKPNKLSSNDDINNISEEKFSKNNETNLANNSNKDQKEKKLSGFYISVAIVVFFLILFLFLLFYIPRKKANTDVEIIIDPIVVSLSGEDHLNTASKYIFNKSSETSYKSEFDVYLTENSYLEYNCTIKNNGSTKIKYSFNLLNNQAVNIDLFYSINGEEFEYEDNKILDYLESKETISFKIIAKIDDTSCNALAKATYNLTLKEIFK